MEGIKKKSNTIPIKYHYSSYISPIALMLHTATIHELPFPLPRYCVAVGIGSVASVV